MRLVDFFDRGAAVKGLAEGYLSGAPVHAALLTGPAGVGKRTLASLCCQALFCQAEERPCGKCPPCRRYLSGGHPDAHRVAGKKRVGVDEVRGLLQALHEAAYEGGWRTVVIEQAGAMTVQAQNCLLKTLEDPPPRTAFLLTATSAAEVLPTIRSRCRPVRVPPLIDSQVETILRERGIDGERAARLASLSGGSVGAALALHGNEAFWALRERVSHAIESIRCPSDAWDALTALKEEKEDAVLVADILERALRDALERSLTGRAAPGWDGLARALNGSDARSLAGLLERIPALRRMLAGNVPWQAALERFVLEYAEECVKWQS